MLLSVTNVDFFSLYSQAKKSQEGSKEVTHKVYFDVEIDGKPAGMFCSFFTKLFCIFCISSSYICTNGSSIVMVSSVSIF